MPNFSPLSLRGKASHSDLGTPDEGLAASGCSNSMSSKQTPALGHALYLHFDLLFISDLIKHGSFLRALE